MKLMSMSFGDFTWSFNPEELKISSAKNAVELKGFGGSSELQPLSLGMRRISGKGSFLGEDAAEKYAGLEALLASGKPQMLCLPERRPMRALLTELSLLASPGSGALGYEFVFTEYRDPEEEMSEKVYIASEGETLIDYALKFGLELSELAAHNRHIPYINYLNEGEQVIVSW